MIFHSDDPSSAASDLPNPESKNETVFSAKLNGVPHSMQSLRVLGKETVQEVYEKNANDCIGFNVFRYLTGGITAIVAFGEFLGPNAGQGHNDVVLTVCALATAVVFREHALAVTKAKDADKARVMLAGDIEKAEYASTKKDLLEQGYFKIVKAANENKEVSTQSRRESAVHLR